MTSFDDAEKHVLKDCDNKISEYRKRGLRRWYLHLFFQAGTIIAGGLTPVFVVSDLPKWAQALPAALAGIFALIHSQFGFRDTWARFVISEHELLRAQDYYLNAKSLYYVDVHGDPMSDDAALKAFRDQVENISKTEMSRWLRQLKAQGLQREQRGKGTGSGSTSIRPQVAAD